MNLDKFYSLRKNFTIIGLTGRAGSGCSSIARKLSNIDFIKNANFKLKEQSIIAEEIKFSICHNYLMHGNNWTPYKIINYKDVLLLHVVYESIQNKDFAQHFIDVLCLNTKEKGYNNRFCKKTDVQFISELKRWLLSQENGLKKHFFKSKLNFNQWLKNIDGNDFIAFYNQSFVIFADELHDKLNSRSITKRSRFNHDLAISLRMFGVSNGDTRNKSSNHDHIYTVAETINRLIKFWRKSNDNQSKIVIDSLKNSLELMYFKEKYGAFYMIAVNKEEKERLKYVEKKLVDRNNETYGPNGEKPDAQKHSENFAAIKEHSQELLNLDDHEVKGNEVNNGEFSSPDVENCIQKSDYHIFHSEVDNPLLSEEEGKKLKCEYQLIKLMALMNQPGIITPTAIERTMQIAYNAKFNSGCISRQVGAVITDKSFIVKSIGWNDVAKDQMPCKLRDLNHLVGGKPHGIFSEYEINGVVEDSKSKKKSSFNELAKKELEKSNQSNLGGRNCSFCFKTFQNAFEREKNQVHTRSLHAEENAMILVSKKGGVGLEGGKLFTTASPCELCSKKAFQLGVTEIFYIDPYPGIAMQHTLKNGIINNDGIAPSNPTMTMFNGAVGRAFHKLYEPFMPYKDEIAILTKLNPKSNTSNNEETIQDLDLSDEKKEKILKIINE